MPTNLKSLRYTSFILLRLLWTVVYALAVQVRPAQIYRSLYQGLENLELGKALVRT